MTVQIPDDANPPNDVAYETAVLAAIDEAVANGEKLIRWVPITNAAKGPSGKLHTITFYVPSNALKVQGFRPGAGARLVQKIADSFGGVMLTPRMLDLMFEQATHVIGPIGRYDPTRMMTVPWMRSYSQAVDQAALAIGYDGTKGLLMTDGKPFVLANVASAAHGANYGWHVKGSYQAPYPVTPKALQKFPYHVIQDLGTYHGLNQDDYASVILFAHRYSIVDGQPKDLYEVYQDPELAPLVSHEGPLHFVRQPGVPPYACTVAKPGEMPLAFDSSGLCPMPPPPDISPNGSAKGIDWPAIGITVAAVLALGLGGAYVLRHGIVHAGPLARFARARENPVTFTNPDDIVLAQLPIGSLLWWNDGPALVVVPGGLAPVSVLPERARHVPDGEPPASFGGRFTLIARGRGVLPTHRTAQDKVMAWWRRARENPADVRTMQAGAINRELDRLDLQNRRLTDAFIEAGRGDERPSETLRKDPATDPLAAKYQTLSARRAELRHEVARRAGPGVNRLPRGFGPLA